MRQFLDVKDRHPDAIVFFRLGDFYEMFYDDAVVASQLLGLTLTARDKQRETPIPMCGVPYHAAKHYLAKLVALGKKVAICDQVEDARKTKKIVRRAVTQVITPGVTIRTTSRRTSPLATLGSSTCSQITTLWPRSVSFAT